jgi:TPR repeat protein
MHAFLLSLCFLLSAVPTLAAASAGLSEAAAAIERGEYAVAHVELTPLAESGNAEAQYVLGRLYAAGQGCSKDESKAVALFRKAAAQGDPSAQNSLAMFLLQGRGVKKNAAEAASWFRRAADQGLTVAEYNLALLYADGRGVAKNPQEAFAWQQRAANQG